MKKKKDVTDRLYDAVIDFIESKGGKVLVIGGVETQQFPEDRKLNFRLAIRFTGKKPHARERGGQAKAGKGVK
jgi:ABC-type sugar transport system substrate-binding protein